MRVLATDGASGHNREGTGIDIADRLGAEIRIGDTCTCFVFREKERTSA